MNLLSLCTPSWRHRLEHRAGRRAFTLLEVMVALVIFAMVITAIYSSWTAILRAARVGNDAAMRLQRSRLASRSLSDALVSAVMFQGNAPLYTFQADTSGDFAALSFVARLPASYLGSGFFGGQVVRRVTFTVESGNDGKNQFVLTQVPLLETNTSPDQVYSLVLAREVNLFTVEFFDPLNGWVPEWSDSNQLPRQVRFQLGFGPTLAANASPQDVTVRTVDIPSVRVDRNMQAAFGPGGGMPRPMPIQPGPVPGAGLIPGQP
jgi:prepilin-type N-terminal cleavage/methylation domain-containing protein